MKLVSLFAAVALAGAAAPPRIELDLSAMITRYGADAVGHPSRSSITHGVNSHPGSQSALGSRHDWSARCPAGPSTTIETCPFPVAQAWDHQDKDITSRIVTRVFLVNKENKLCHQSENHAFCGCSDTTDSHCLVTSVDFEARAKYVFLYDVSDKSGNAAEQVVYMLELDDTGRPTIHVCGGTASGEADLWEAATGGQLCRNTEADDTVDNSATMAANMMYRVLDMSDEENPVSLCNKPSNAGVSLKNINADGSQAETTTPNWQSYASYLANPESHEECGFYALSNAANTTDGKRGPLSTSGVGKFLVEFRVCDDAGEYGEHGHDNCRLGYQDIEVVDTTAPVVTVEGGNELEHECKYDRGDNVYADPATATNVVDTLDTLTLAKDLSGNVVASGIADVDESIIQDYIINYTATDTNGSCSETTDGPKGPCQSDVVSRRVSVVDTQKPFINSGDQSQPLGKHVHVVTNANTHLRYADLEEAAGGWTCVDACSGDADMAEGAKGYANRPTKKPVVFDPPLPEKLDTAGEYTATYICVDKSNNERVRTRVFEIVDGTQPVIDIDGDPIITIEADLNETYVDAGAFCSDYFDGNINNRVVTTNLNNNVVTSGDNVDLGVDGPTFTGNTEPGKYIIEYNCADLATNAEGNNNDANTERRTVYVQDTTCPSIDLAGDDEVTIEAGFAYVDPGFTATDNLNEDVTDDVITDGASVGEVYANLKRNSCRQIKAANPAATTGKYYITRQADDNKMTRVLVHCDMGGDKALTFMACTGCKTVSSTYRDDDGDCPAFGLEMIRDFGTGRGFTKNGAGKIDRASGGEWKAQFEVQGFFVEDTTDYLCGINDQDLDEGASDQGTTLTQVSEIDQPKAHAGIYVVKYEVQDAAGNWNFECGVGSDTCYSHRTTPRDQDDEGKCCGMGASVPTATVTQCGNNGEHVKRTVYVRDTLPPVISLHLKKHGEANFARIQASDGSQESELLGTPTNPAGSPGDGTYQNPFLADTYQPDADTVTANSFPYMAEQATSSANGWLIAAAASSMVGVALLVHASRSSAPTVVEV